MSTIADILSLGRTNLTMPAMPKVDLNHYDSLVSLFVRLGACYLCHVDCISHCLKFSNWRCSMLYTMMLHTVDVG